MELGIRLFNKLSFTAENNNNTLVPILNTELGVYGYTMTPILMNMMSSLSEENFKSIRNELFQTLGTITGSEHTHRRLFTNFPYDTPDQHEYMEKRVIGEIASQHGIALGGNRLTALACGHTIDSALFNIDEFGACPICQFADPNLPQSDEAMFEYASVTPLKPLDYTGDWSVEGSRIISRNSSISMDERKFLLELIRNGTTLTISGDVFKEILPYVYMLGGPDAIRNQISGATDILRIATFVSNQDADLSLKDNVKFRLSTSHKRKLMMLLENTRNLEEDMLRHRERWLRLGEVMNPNSKVNSARFPKVAKAFDVLRNSHETIKTFGRVVEASLRNGDLTDEFFKTMKSRPGEFARRLDHLMRKHDYNIVIKEFEEVVSEVKTDTLMTLRKYFNSRDLMGQRVFIPKGQANKMQIVDDAREPLSVEAVMAIVTVIEEELVERFAKLDPMGSVYIDPLLKDIVMTYNRRGDTSTSTPISKGSRFDVNGEVVRLFVWWENGKHSRVDVDLSAVYMNDKFEQTGSVAFTNLRNGNVVVHSGDIQNAPAPDGASEFIDVSVGELAKTSRYLAVSINSFTGQTFNTYPCHAGFMTRDSMRSGRVYEPASVELKFEVNSATTASIPMIFDLKERKVIYVDLQGSQNRWGAVASQSKKFETMTRGVVTLPDRKPTVYDYVFFNALARGSITSDKSEADVVFDLSNIDELKIKIEEGVL
jgi:stress response protein SCP2